MQATDIATHLYDLETNSQGLPEEDKEECNINSDDEVRHVPLCPKALVHDVVKFDVQDLDFLSKLGEGGFGTVRASRFNLASLRGNSPQSSSTAASSSSDDEPHQRVPKVKEESKFARMKTRLPPRQQQSSDSVLDQVGFHRSATIEPRRCRRGKIYAVKIISKHKVLQTQQQEHLFNEIKYMAKMNHRFLVQMRGVAQDSRNIYILMDYLQHGELMNVLKEKGRMPSSLAKFYLAQIILIFEYMHGQDLIYRDLKPENVLVQDNGYIKLTDFGFVKRLKSWERTYTLCGTPEYIPPEIILNVGHGRAADWYTLGIFAYELIMGRLPFMHQDTYEVFKMTLREPIPFPNGFPSDAKSLIKHLTAHDLSKRYGNLVNGSGDVRAHRFFKNMDFAQIASQQALAPHVPRETTKNITLLKEKGLKSAQIPESQSNETEPEIQKTKDLFQEWF